jgi:hypothetical protein
VTGLTESKTLQMIFLNANNARVTISVAEPKDDLTSTEVEEAMDEIINQNIINSTGGDLVQVVGARLVTRQVVELIEM